MSPLKIVALTIATLLVGLATAQNTEPYVDEEDCGCDLYYINGIQKTYSNGKFGFKRADGTVIAPNIYIETDRFQNGYCKVWLEAGKCGLIDSTGREMIPCLYADLDYFSCGLARFFQNYRYGFLDTAGNVAIPATYVSASAFFEDKAVVAVITDSFGGLGYGFIDKQNNLVVPATYEYAMPYTEGVAAVKAYDRWGFIDHNGREVLPIKYELLGQMQNGYTFAVFNGDAALIGKDLKPITPFIYEDMQRVSEGLCAVKKMDCGDLSIPEAKPWCHANTLR